MPASTTGNRHLTTTLILCCLAQFMVILDVSVVNVALPSIRNGLHFSEQDLQWVVNAYTVTFAGFLLLGGRAADLLGRRKVFVAGLALFSVASLLGGLAQSEGWLIIARGVQGLGAAILSPAALSIVTTTFRDGSERNKALGVWGAVAGSGGAAGVLLGGVLTETLNWRWILFINVPIAVAAAFVTQRAVAEGRNPHRAKSFDLSGALTATVGLSLLVLGIVRTDVTGWGNASTLGFVIAGVLLLAAFLFIEGRVAKEPLMPLRIYRSRTLTSANIVVLLTGGATFGMWFFVSLYLQQVLGYSAIQTGLAFLPMTACIAVGSALASRLVIRVGAKRLLVFGMTCQAIGLLIYSGVTADGSYLTNMLIPGLFVAVGIGFSFVPATICAVAGVAPQEAGLASGLVNTSRLFGGALGLAVLAAIATATTNGDLHHAVAANAALTDGFTIAFLLGAAFSVIGAGVAMFGLPAIHPRSTPAASVAVEA